MRKIFTLIICFVLFFSSNAQPPNYAFQALSGTYTPLVGGIPVSLHMAHRRTFDDGLKSSKCFPIGFTFNYNGTNYTLI